MSFKALRIVAVAGGPSFLPKELGAEPGQAFAKLKAQGQYGVYLVRDADLAVLREAGEQFADRKSKNEHKELSKVLLGHAKIPFVSGGYTNAGRLMQGVEALLRRAAREGDRNLYVVGADEKIFKELWGRAAPEAEAAPQSRGNGGGDFGVATRQGDGGGPASSRRLFDLLPEGDIPEGLVRSYVGESDRVREVRKLILLAANTDVPVLITGDTGTGKEVVARAVHTHSARRSGHQFVAVNCGAIPRDLLEAELFGSVRGVATGVNTRAGLWELTGEGTLFLDEIGDLSPEHQVKILRALQENTIRRVGEAREREVGARIIAATNRDLLSMVREGRFREDLYYRLRAFVIMTPALHEHPKDIPLLAQTLWKSIAGGQAGPLPEDVLSRLMELRWPGNVRELRSVLSNVYTLFGDDFGVEHLDAVVQHPSMMEDAGSSPSVYTDRRKGKRRGRWARASDHEELLSGLWEGTGEDLLVPGHIELDQKHTYQLKLKLERKEGGVCGTLTVYVKERERTDEAFIELISISGEYFSFQYSLTTPHSSHYGIMMMHLLPVGNQMKGFFLTKKIFEARIGLGALFFQKV